MTCQELATRIEQLQPEASAREVARLCLLLTNFVDDLSELEDEGRLAEAWQEMGMRLQAASDQHAAMTEDLEELSRIDSSLFSLEQVWVLIRAIKVQSQIIQLYVGQPGIEV
jgi:ABC-type transporter Mla MlaB component